MTITLCCSDIPLWLHDSDFCRNLSASELEREIEIPTECFRLTDDVHTTEDLGRVLKVMQFWGLSNIPHSVLQYCFLNDSSIWNEALTEVAGIVMPEHKSLKSVFGCPQCFSLENVLSTSRTEMVSFWVSKNSSDSEHGKNAMAQACRFGRLDLVKELQEKGYPWDSYAYCAAAQYGHLSVLKYLHERGCKYNKKALIYAARGGQLMCMKYLHTIGCPWDEGVTSEFAIPAHYVYISKTMSAHCIWTDDWTIFPPVNGYLDCLRYALSNNCAISTEAVENACCYGLLDCLQLLYEYGVVFSHFDASMAATYGHLSCLQFLCDIGVDCSAEVASDAARHGQLHCLQFLHKHHYPWNEYTVESAAASGHLNCLQYLHKNNCPWTMNVVNYAANFGHLDCLIYAMEHDCPYDAHCVLSSAIASSNIACLTYLLEKQQLRVALGESLFSKAFVKTDLGCVKHLIDVGCPLITCEFKSCFKFNESSVDDDDLLQCLQYAFENGWQYSDALYNSLAYYNNHPGTNRRIPLCMAYIHSIAR